MLCPEIYSSAIKFFGFFVCLLVIFFSKFSSIHLVISACATVFIAENLEQFVLLCLCGDRRILLLSAVCLLDILGKSSS